MTETHTVADANKARAIEYADYGFSVRHKHPDKKQPWGKWREFQQKRTEPEDLEHLNFEHGVALITGRISQVVAIDADDQAAVDKLEESGIPENVPCYGTTRGRQYLLKYPDEIDVRNSAGTLVEGFKIDVRGNGGATVIPPTPGRVWITPLPESIDDIPDMPDWMIERIKARKNGAKNGHNPCVDLAALLEGVELGQRDQMLFEGISSLRARRVPKPVAIPYVREVAQNCNPPFDVAAAIKKVDEVYDRYPAGTGDDQPTHDILRNRWLNRYPNFAYGQGKWKRYEDGVWHPAEDETVLGQIIDVLEDAKPEKIKPTAAMAKSVVEMARVKRFVPAAKWDHDPDIIVCQNGTLHIPTRELMPHDPEYYATSAVRYDYDPDAVAPAWQHYLETTLSEDEIRFFQEYVGYAFTTDCSHELALLLSGERGSGKSTFIEGVAAAAGDRHGIISLKRVDKSPFALGHIAGKTLLTATENSIGYFRSTDILNAVISGEEVDIEVKYKQSYKIRSVSKLIVAMNEKPHIADPGDGFFRRAKIKNFDPRPEDQRDPEVKKAIMTEGAGILNWALDGLDKLRSRGRFDVPDTIKSASDDFQKENDVAAMFVEDRCQRGAELTIKPSTLYISYAQYCELFGYSAKSAKRVAKDWERLGFSKIKKGGYDYWKGLDLDESKRTYAD